VLIQMNVNQIAVSIAEFSRDQCIAELAGVPYLQLDFTPQFIDSQSTDQLRHILLAACLQARQHLDADPPIKPAA